jgi:hypothetical protein
MVSNRGLDLSRTERLVPELKALLRKAGVRTKVILWTTIAERPHEFSSGECRNQIGICGYEPG